MCRRHVLLWLLVPMLVTLPAAAAWACTPRAVLKLDKASYAPGDTMIIEGTHFLADTPVTFSLDGGPELGAARASSTGYVKATFTVPATAASGAVVARARDGVTNEVFVASAGLVIAQPTPTAQPPVETVQPVTPVAPAPAPVAAAPGADSQRAPVAEPSAPASAPAATAARKPARGGATQAADATRGAVAARPAREAAASTDSAAATVSPIAPQAAATRRAATAPEPARSSAGSALSDLWSAFDPNRSSPRATATPGASHDGGGSSGATWILLFALGLGALMWTLVREDAQPRRSDSNPRS